MAGSYLVTRKILKLVAEASEDFVALAAECLNPSEKRITKKQTAGQNNFDIRRLKDRLKKLEQQKDINVFWHTNNQIAIKITKKGRAKLLKFNLSELTIPKPKKWDFKWRIVSYDISDKKKNARDALRKTLKRLGFLGLNRSVYLYPYPCEDIIEFIRELYKVGNEVMLLTVGRLENEEVYKEYFQLI